MNRESIKLLALDKARTDTTLLDELVSGVIENKDSFINTHQTVTI